MTLQDKAVDQAQAIVEVPDFQALPRTGPGRWVYLAHDITLYTNDDNVLHARSSESSIYESLLFQELDKAYQAGETATAAFDRLRHNAPVVTGDLSDMRL